MPEPRFYEFLQRLENAQTQAEKRSIWEELDEWSASLPPDPFQSMDVAALVRRLQSNEPRERRRAARELGRRYTVGRPTAPRLAQVASEIAEANDHVSDVAQPFVHNFTHRDEFTAAWHDQCEVSLVDWLSDRLCYQPDVDDEFAPYGLVDLARDFLKGSPAVTRRILEFGKPWRAFLIASGSRTASLEDQQLMEELALLDDLEVATRAVHGLAHTYRIVHPRGEREGWVLAETVPPFQLFWTRISEMPVPYRVWGWRTDLAEFPAEEALQTIEQIISPESLGPFEDTKYPRYRDTEAFTIVFDDPTDSQQHSVFVPNSLPTRFKRFQLRPKCRLPWIELPFVKLAGQAMSEPRQLKPVNDRQERRFLAHDTDLTRTCLSPTASRYNHCGNAYCMSKQYEQAIVAYNSSAGLDPSFACTYENRGNVWRVTGEFDKAIADYTEALRLDPSLATSYFWRGDAWHEKDEYDQAIADFSSSLQFDPTDYWAYLHRGNAWIDKGEYRLAIADYSRFLESDPTSIVTYVNRAKALSAMKEYSQALADYNEALRRGATEGAVYSGRGFVWARLREYRRAIDDYDAAIAVDSTATAAYTQKGFLLVTATDPTVRDGDMAEQLVEKALAIDSANAFAISTKACIAAYKGEFGTAIQLEQEALRDEEFAECCEVDGGVYSAARIECWRNQVVWLDDVT